MNVAQDLILANPKVGSRQNSEVVWSAARPDHIAIAPNRIDAKFSITFPPLLNAGTEEHSNRRGVLSVPAVIR